MHAPPGSASDGASELLERSGQLSALADALDGVRSTSHGRLASSPATRGSARRRSCGAPATAVAGRRASCRGACDALFTPRPLGPLIDIAEATGGELQELVGSGARPHQLAAALVRELGTRAPTIVVLEDLHWADEATLDVLRLIARRVEAVSALLLASYRDEAFDPAAPLRIVLGELATGYAIDRVALAPLSSDAVAQLAEPHRRRRGGALPQDRRQSVLRY